MTTASDVVRVLACLGLLAVACLIVASMKPRLYDHVSRWLAAFVFTITLSAFLGTASRIGTEEPIVWYGAPMRLIAVAFGLMYIWKTRETKNVPPRDKTHDHDLMEQDEDNSLFDRLLKNIMPNGTVMRRFIAAAYILGIISGLVGIRLIERTDDNANRGAAAICAIIKYGEDTLKAIPASPSANPAATQRFQKLVQDMNDTHVRCTPPPARPTD